jgi:uncharacterized membrane protein YccF (DUF307 family)
VIAAIPEGSNANRLASNVWRYGKAIAHLHLVEGILLGDWDLLFDFHWLLLLGW